MGDAISSIKQEIEALLNSSAFSWDSLEGIVLIVIVLCLIHSLWKKLYDVAIWCFLGILFCQIMYSLSLTGFNDIVPLSDVFKYDIFAAIAQCFVGTKISDGILWFDAFLTVTFKNLWQFGGTFITAVLQLILNIFKSMTVMMGIKV